MARGVKHGDSASTKAGRPKPQASRLVSLLVMERPCRLVAGWWQVSALREAAEIRDNFAGWCNGQRDRSRMVLVEASLLIPGLP